MWHPVDDIICDYNYVFDPNVYLKRFFCRGDPGRLYFLVDEAHNLVERSREMYSAEIYKEDFLAVKKIVKRYRPGLEQQFNHCNRILLEYKRECEKYKVYDNIGNLMFYLMKLASELDEFLQRSTEFPERKEVSEFYFGLRNFINMYERVDEHYVIYTEHMEDERFKMKLYCVDPSLNLQECIDRGNSAIFFSATFLPIQYYKICYPRRKITMRFMRRQPFRRSRVCYLWEATSAAGIQGETKVSLNGSHSISKRPGLQKRKLYGFLPIL